MLTELSAIIWHSSICFIEESNLKNTSLLIHLSFSKKNRELSSQTMKKSKKTLRIFISIHQYTF